MKVITVIFALTIGCMPLFVFAANPTEIKIPPCEKVISVNMTGKPGIASVPIISFSTRQMKPQEDAEYIRAYYGSRSELVYILVEKKDGRCGYGR